MIILHGKCNDMVYEPRFRVGDVVRHEASDENPLPVGYVTKIQVENFLTKVWVTIFDKEGVAIPGDEWYNSVELTLVSRGANSEV